MNTVWLLLEAKDIYISIFKAFVFGVLITLVCATQGYRTTGGAKDVGISTTKSAIGATFALLLAGVLLLGMATKEAINPAYDYVSKSIFDYEEEIKVVNTGEKIQRPYSDGDVKIVKDYYDYSADAAKQESALIYYENTYIPSSGVSYSNNNTFDVLSVLEGKVVEVKEDLTVGNTIVIEHTNGIVSVYQSVDNISVKQGDIINAGFKIAASSTSNISPELNNHLYFELIIDGICVNPENYYDKLISEL
jgi:stage II sporulation protein Q